jgi:hypothetical protein
MSKASGGKEQKSIILEGNKFADRNNPPRYWALFEIIVLMAQSIYAIRLKNDHSLITQFLKNAAQCLLRRFAAGCSFGHNLIDFRVNQFLSCEDFVSSS